MKLIHLPFNETLESEGLYTHYSTLTGYYSYDDIAHRWGLQVGGMSTQQISWSYDGSIEERYKGNLDWTITFWYKHNTNGVPHLILPLYWCIWTTNQPYWQIAATSTSDYFRVMPYETAIRFSIPVWDASAEIYKPEYIDIELTDDTWHFYNFNCRTINGQKEIRLFVDDTQKFIDSYTIPDMNVLTTTGVKYTDIAMAHSINVYASSGPSSNNSLLSDLCLYDTADVTNSLYQEALVKCIYKVNQTPEQLLIKPVQGQSTYLLQNNAYPNAFDYNKVKSFGTFQPSYLLPANATDYNAYCTDAWVRQSDVILTGINDKRKTIAFWLLPTSNINSSVLIISAGHYNYQSASWSIGVKIVDNKARLTFGEGSDWNHEIGTNSFSLDEWHYVVINTKLLSGTQNLSFYVDNVYYGDAQSSRNYGSLYIGLGWDWRFLISDITVYNDHLSAELRSKYYKTSKFSIQAKGCKVDNIKEADILPYKSKTLHINKQGIIEQKNIKESGAHYLKTGYTTYNTPEYIDNTHSTKFSKTATVMAEQNDNTWVQQEKDYVLETTNLKEI